MREFSHLRILSVFIVVLFGFLSLSALWLSHQQRDMLREATRQQAEHDLGLMVDTSVEALLKSDYVTVRTFVERWGKTHQEFNALRFVAPNGYVLAEYNNPPPKAVPTYALTKDVVVEGTTAATVSLAGDYRKAETIAAQLKRRLLLVAFVVTSMLGAALWLVIRKMALEPLEEAVKRQTRALSEANAELAQEVGERKTAQDALRQREERLALILNSIAEGIYGVDLEGNCIFCNPAALRLLGYGDQEELIGKNMHALVNHDATVPRKSVATPAERGGHGDDEIFHRADGSTFPVEYRTRPIVSNGTPVGAVTAFTDISERRQMEERLRQGQKMEAIGTLAGGIAHDFNNILNVIFGYTELALLDGNDPEKVRRHLEAVGKGAERARQLVWQILAFSRKSEQERHPLQISLVIKEALKMLRAAIPATIEIRQELVSEGTVVADPTQIHQVIMNLCTNAYHAMRERGGTLTVALTEVDTEALGEAAVELPAGRYLRLTVSDTGSGIDPRIVDRIFEPYFTTKGQGEGTGLGLAVVHGIVKSHHGHIAVNSELGVGTRFQIYLPSAQQMALPLAVEGDSQSLAGHGERILFVDDEEQICAMAEAIFPEYGYRVSTFSRAGQALAEFEKGPDRFDLVITDMTMPQMNGAEFSRQVLALRPEIPVILCTGYNTLIDRERATQAGISDYLTKPITLPQLLAATAKALANAGRPEQA